MEIDVVLHGLRVRQRKLENQNESLRSALVGLDALRERYANFYEMAPVGYVVLSEEGMIQEANLRASTMLGMPRGTLDNQPLTRFFFEDDQQFYHLFPKALFDTGEPHVFELRMKQQDGAHLWVRLEAIAVKNQGNGARICLAAMSDVTETRKLQTDMARTELMARMDFLAGGMAHEINNPLTFVLHNQERLLEDLSILTDVMGRFRHALRELDGNKTLDAIAGESASLIGPTAFTGLTERVQQANEGMLRIKAIAERLTAFSREEQESLSMVDLNHAAEKAIKVTTNEIKCRAVMHKELGRLPGMMALDKKLEQVFKNLIVNAAVAIDEGAVRDNHITIRTWADNGHIFAEVTDTGRGIPKEDLDNIFEPFFTTKGPERGLGLGLAIARRIVSSSGGDIAVESTLGKGTRFLLQFPIGHGVTTLSPPLAAKTPGTRGRILVVDDEAFILQVLVGMLGGQHEILAVDSGRAAKELLETDTRFDLILCDLMMPEVSGIDLHGWLADHHPSLARQLVFMTGGVFAHGTEAYLERVTNIVVKKPFDRASMSKLVGEQLLAARSER